MGPNGCRARWCRPRLAGAVQREGVGARYRDRCPCRPTAAATAPTSTSLTSPAACSRLRRTPSPSMGYPARPPWDKREYWASHLEPGRNPLSGSRRSFHRPSRPPTCRLSRATRARAPDLASPTEPIVVSFLAHEAVGHASTEGAQVQALVNWFRSGNFRYTSDPPPATGSDPLVQFLTRDACRVLPTVRRCLRHHGPLPRHSHPPRGRFHGRTTGCGQLVHRDRGRCARVAPGLPGPGPGWVSVEPTPPAPNDTTAPAGVVGPNAPASHHPDHAGPPAASRTASTVAGGSRAGLAHPPQAIPRPGTEWRASLVAHRVRPCRRCVPPPSSYSRSDARGRYWQREGPRSADRPRLGASPASALHRRGLAAGRRDPGEYATRLDL